MKINYKQIMSFRPNFNLKSIGMQRTYKAELKNFIEEYKDKMKDKSDILWVVLRKEFFSEQDLRLFAVWAASQVKHLLQDKRSLKALEVAEEFAFGKAEKDELKAAYFSARAADAVVSASPASAAVRFACSAYATRAAVRSASASAYASCLAYAAYCADNAYVTTFYPTISTQIDTILKMIDAPNGEWFLKLKGEQK